ncbi:MAG: ABC transporter, partial [Mesorhizobium sp.]
MRVVSTIRGGSRLKSISSGSITSGGFKVGAVLLALSLASCAALPGGRPAPLDTFELSADRLPMIVQARLAETFQRSGSFTGVGKPGEGLAIDYQVIVEIRSFEVRVDGGEHAEVELFVRLLNDRNGEVRASKTFSAIAPVSGGGNQAYVGALDAAFG